MSSTTAHLLHRKHVVSIWAPKHYLTTNLFINTTQEGVHNTPLMITAQGEQNQLIVWELSMVPGGCLKYEVEHFEVYHCLITVLDT